MTQLTWKLKTFEHLTPFELYAVLRLRSEVFVVEQNCAFLDMDNIDLSCYHLMGWNENNLVAYTRLMDKHVKYDMMSIGRVVTSPAYRGQGFGMELMKQSIDRLYDLFGKNPIKIGGQLYLRRFYESFGFEKSSEIYLEDNIEHIEMIKPLSN